MNSAIDFDGNLIDRKANQVNFDPKVPDKPSAKISRDLTPFPKELHNKAMQWRATRDIATGGGVAPKGEAGATEAAGAEGGEGVLLRQNVVARPSNNRNSLMNALCNPLDEVLAADVVAIVVVVVVVVVVAAALVVVVVVVVVDFDYTLILIDWLGGGGK